MRIVITILITVLWTTFIAYLWRPFTEPLTGISISGYFSTIGVQFIVLGVALFLLILRRRGKGVGIFLVFVCLLTAFPPVSSEAGVTFTVSNTTPSSTQVSIQREHSPAREIHFTLAPGESRTYKTAPGDWPSSAVFTARAGSVELCRPIREFRGSTIVISADSITLQKRQP